MTDPLTDLSTKGVSIWRDDLSRQQACIEVRNPRGMSAPLCTPFIGH
jgi:hypothetical protein